MDRAKKDSRSEEEATTPHDMKKEAIQMTYKVTRAQYRALEGLAHWCYQAARCDAEHDAEGSEQARQTLATFPAQLDRLGIPYYVQNAVSAWAQDFRVPGNIRESYLDQALRRRGIACEGV